MELTEDEISEKRDEQCMHCMRNTLIPYGYEWTCLSCRYNVLKGKHELTKKSTKETEKGKLS